MAAPSPSEHNDYRDDATGKASLRRKFREARADFVAAMDASTRWRAFTSPPSTFRARIADARAIAVYVALENEADPAAIAALAAGLGKTVCLPFVRENRETIGFAAWDMSLNTLVSGPFNIFQPSNQSSRVAPDLIVTPLVAFDRSLTRLGQGMGFYDRAFASLPEAYRLGLAWSVQQAEALPTEPWDIPLHSVLTELGMIEPTA